MVPLLQTKHSTDLLSRFTVFRDCWRSNMAGPPHLFVAWLSFKTELAIPSDLRTIKREGGTVLVAIRLHLVCKQHKYKKVTEEETLTYRYGIDVF